MKNLLLILACSLALFSCNSNQGWTEKQRDEFKQTLKIGDDFKYLKNMTEEEFNKFAADVTTSIESTYPNYSVFLEMPSVSDTVSAYVIRRFSNVLESDYRTLHNMYPYDQLVNEGILPAGLTKESKEAFYACLASKIRAKYESMGFFLGALTDGNEAEQQAQIFIQQCAMEMTSAVMIEEQIIK